MILLCFEFHHDVTNAFESVKGGNVIAPPSPSTFLGSSYSLELLESSWGRVSEQWGGISRKVSHTTLFSLLSPKNVCSCEIQMKLVGISLPPASPISWASITFYCSSIIASVKMVAYHTITTSTSVGCHLTYSMPLLRPLHIHIQVQSQITVMVDKGDNMQQASEQQKTISAAEVEQKGSISEGLSREKR